MVVLVLLAAPFLVAALLGALLARGWVRTVALLGVGLLIGLAFVLHVYLSAPIDFAHDLSGCECEQYLGRWWDPSLVLSLVAVGLAVWTVGIGVGALLNAVVRLALTVRRPLS